MTDKPKTLTPKLRFPDFAKDGPWLTRPLDELCDRIVDKVGDVTLTPVSITAGRGFVSQAEKFGRDISGAQYNNYIRLRRGEFAYNKGNSNLYPQGCVYQLKEFDEAAASTAFICFRLRNGNAPGFFEGLFEKNAHGRQLQKFLTSGARSDGLLNIRADEFFSVVLPVPPRPAEQRKIAACLTSLDEWIAAEGRKLKTLRANKKGIMQQLFPREGELRPRFRFPGVRDAWDKCTLGALSASISSGRDKSSPDGPFDLYGSTGVIGKTSNGTFVGTFLLVARVGANAGLLTKVNGSFGVTDNTLVIDLMEKKNNDFIFHYLDNFDLNRMIFGSGQPLITGGQLKALPILLPGESERERIAGCLSSLDALIATQSRKLNGLRAHKKGLMQQLLSLPEGD